MAKRGYFSDFGGAYTPEIPVAGFDELAAYFGQAQGDAVFSKGKAGIAATGPQTLLLVEAEGAGALGEFILGLR